MPDGNPGRELNRVDEELDLLIARRHEERERNGEPDTANAAELWREESYSRDEAEERRLAWLDWHTRQAEILEALAGEHRAEVGRLLDAAALANRG
jgi:hypothetical protein